MVTVMEATTCELASDVKGEEKKAESDKSPDNRDWPRVAWNKSNISASVMLQDIYVSI